MKNLRHLLRRSGWLASNKQQRPASSSGEHRNGKRRLHTETLEKRQLLAGDIALAHNYVHSLDVDDNYEITARDALIVVNHLNKYGSGHEITEFDESMHYVDVNGDGMVTVNDALLVINGLHAGEGVGELVELQLNARDANDAAIAPDANGAINVTVGEVFNLELGFTDLRAGATNRLGVAKYIADLSVSVDNVLVPAVGEAQRIGFSGELADETQGTVTFSLVGGTQTVEIPVADFVATRAAPRIQTVNALVQLGYAASDLSVVYRDLRDTGNRVPGSVDLFVEVTYVGPGLRFQNVPGLQVSVSGTAATIQTTTQEINPLNTDGTINGAVLPFNLITTSRTTGNVYYNSLPTGSYSETGGFDNVGGTNFDGPPSDEINLAQFFDAISIPVVVRQAVQGLTVTINPANDEPADVNVEGLIMWRDNDPLPVDKILIDNNGRVTINATGGNRAPTVSGPVTATFSEDDASSSVSLLTGATDADGDTLNVATTPAPVLTGNTAGVTVSGNSLTINPAAYGSLNTGETATATVNYTISDGKGGTVAQTATITFTGVTDTNRNPVVSGPVTATFSEDDAATTVNLLTGASDPDGDTLNVATTPAPVLSGDTAGVSLNGNSLNINPGAYGALNTGQTATATVNYTISDGQGGTVTQTATITFTGVTDTVPNRNPVVSGPVTATFSEDAAATTVNLLTGASDPDGDTLNVATTPAPVLSGNTVGVTLNGNSLNINPGAYGALNTGQTATATVNYTISDGRGGSVAQTATITFTGVTDTVPNRNPVVSGPVTATFSEDAAATTVNLLTGASDPDGDTLNVATTPAPVLSGNTAGVTLNGNSLNINPGAYGALNTGQTATATVNYTISDGRGGSVAQTATITFTGVTDVVNRPPTVGAPISRTFTEDDANATVSLLTGATDPDGDTLTVANFAVTSGNAAGITLNGSSINVNPGAYGSLNTGQNSVITLGFNVVDGKGGSVAQTATITITGITDPFTASTVSGAIFIDLINNFSQVLPPTNAAPIRDGVKSSNEDGLSGIPVRLVATGTNNAPTVTVYTNMDGAYRFTGVAPGTYNVVYDLPDTVVFVGTHTTPITIGAAGGQSASGGNVGALGLRGGLTNLDILVSSYMRANPGMSTISNGGLEGGSVGLDANGNQTLFKAGEGFDGVDFAELTLNASRDSALLTIIEDGVVKTAQLSKDHFVVSRDGTAVQFFGGKEDFDFTQSLSDLVTAEYNNYRNAIDQILGQI